jgi:hypothetical protein
MEQDLNKKKELRDRVISFFKKNIKKFYITIIILSTVITLIVFLIIKSEKENILISEKYIQAGIQHTAGNIKKSKIIYEEIILSKNKFYSILALNNILEKDLEKNKIKIFEYFDILENINNTKEQNDIILLKKALYLIKISDVKKGNEILKNLIKSNSDLKLIAEEIITK